VKVDLGSFVSQHDVVILEPATDWTSGLTVGNGLVGAVAYQPEERLEWAINHLEVSQGLSAYDADSPDRQKVRAMPVDADGQPLTHQRVLPLMDEGRWEELDALYGNPFTMTDDPDGPGEAAFHSPVCPVACWLRIHPGTSKREMAWAPLRHESPAFQQRLDLLQSRLMTRIPAPSGQGEIRTFVLPDRPVVVVVIEGPQPAELVKRLELHRPPIDTMTETVSIDVGQADDGAAELTVRHKYTENGFEYAVAARVYGAQWQACPTDAGPAIELTQPTAKRIVVLLAVGTCLDGPDPLAAAQTHLDACGPDALEAMEEENRSHWADFWSRSAVRTGDAFLDALWYVNLHALACSNGRGNRLTQSACGLSGIFHATDRIRWGNGWVLDVNIQEAYSPAWTTNHPELAEPFFAGIEALGDGAGRMAREFFDSGGLCFGWPWYYASYYHCAGPWYCLYLWWQFLFTQDTDFLRDRAYPVMRGTCEFLQGYLQQRRDGRYGIWPSISPENRARPEPAVSGFTLITRNPAIDLSLIRHLFTSAVEAADVLGETGDEVDRWREVAVAVAHYGLANSPYGSVIADSESDCRPEEVELRHASRLMAIWPAGEFGLHSTFDWRVIATSTIQDTADRAEIVPHTFGWIAAAAARMGLGQVAREHLLNVGCGAMLRPNGLFAESTPRFQQILKLDMPTCPDAPMLEGGSSTVAAVTEMLLHSHEGCIRVFPALPDPDADAQFHRLRAMGAHLVSACRRDGDVEWVRIESLAGRPVTLANPWWPERRLTVLQGDGKALPTDGDATITFQTRPGTDYLIVPVGADPSAATAQPPAPPPPSEAHIHEARNAHGHHLWIGRSGETRVLEAIQAFLNPTWVGNELQRKHCPYRFDFGVGTDPADKGLDHILPPPIRPVQRPFVFRITPQTAYHPNRGYGWVGHPNVRAADSQSACPLRRDTISGRAPTTFRIDLEAGLYELMFVAGGPTAETWTHVELSTGEVCKPGASLLPGQFETPVVSVHLSHAMSVDVQLSSAMGHRILWSIAGLFVRMVL